MRCTALLLALACGLAGCSPASITFSLGPTDEPLQETTVFEDGGGAKVAQIDIRGLIADEERSALFGNGANPVDELVSRLEKASQDREVRAVVLRINSPGGTVAASESMYREVRRFRETTGKPVVASMGEVAASGGYYLAMAGDEVIAQSTTITGSIGVIIPTVNFSDGLSRIGIHARSVKSGRNKDLANPLEPMRDEQYAVLQHMVDQFYAEFRGLVIERRAAAHHDLASQADELMDGRVFTGKEAAQLGLVDGTGDVRDAYERAKSLAGLQNARLVKYHSEGRRPRSAYAEAGPTPAGTDLNLVKIQGLDSLIGMAGGRAFYLWMP